MTFDHYNLTLQIFQPSAGSDFLITGAIRIATSPSFIDFTAIEGRFAQFDIDFIMQLAHPLSKFFASFYFVWWGLN